MEESSMDNRTNTTYTHAVIYTKNGDLLEYYTHTTKPLGKREYYAREREIQLIAMFRFEGRRELAAHRRTFCKIKCPINPMPVKGEFEVPSIGALEQFLRENGWNLKHRLHLDMFK